MKVEVVDAVYGTVLVGAHRGDATLEHRERWCRLFGTGEFLEFRGLSRQEEREKTKSRPKITPVAPAATGLGKRRTAPFPRKGRPTKNSR